MAKPEIFILNYPNSWQLSFLLHSLNATVHNNDSASFMVPIEERLHLLLPVRTQLYLNDDAHFTQLSRWDVSWGVRFAFTSGINYFMSEVGDNWSLCTLRPTAAQQTVAKQLIYFSPSPSCSFAIVLWEAIIKWHHVKITSFFSFFQTGERTSPWESVGKKCFGQCKGSLKFYDQPKVTLGTVSTWAWITYRKATYHPGRAFVADPHHKGATQKKQPEVGREKKGNWWVKMLFSVKWRTGKSVWGPISRFHLKVRPNQPTKQTKKGIALLFVFIMKRTKGPNVKFVSRGRHHHHRRSLYAKKKRRRWSSQWLWPTSQPRFCLAD